MRLAGTLACNKRVLENLTRTGAFSSLEPNRAKLFNNIEYALKKAQQKAKDDASAQANFFDLMAGGEEKASDSELRDCPPFSPDADLKNERDLLGVYISGHPLQSCSRLISEISEVCIRSRPAGAKEDSLEYLPFSLAKIAKKKPEPEDEAAPQEHDADADDDAPAADAMPEGDPDDDADDEDRESARTRQLSPIDELLNRAKDDDWMLKGLARSIVKARGDIPWSDKAAFDKAANTERARLKKRFDKGELDRFLLKRAEVRVVAILETCSIKVPKPRPDGSVGQKWAILSLDDGTGQADAMCYAQVWSKYGPSVEGRVDQLVMVCGEVTHRVNYDKDDALKMNPRVGDIQFVAKEVYPLEARRAEAPIRGPGAEGEGLRDTRRGGEEPGPDASARHDNVCGRDGDRAGPWSDMPRGGQHRLPFAAVEVRPPGRRKLRAGEQDPARAARAEAVGVSAADRATRPQVLSITAKI